MGLFDSISSLVGNVAKIVVTPVAIVADVANAVVQPVAEGMEEISEVVKDLTNEK